MDKINFRKQALTKRKHHDSKKNQSIIDHFLNSPLFLHSKNLMLYVSFGSEITTHQIIQSALKQGKKVSVPIIQSKTTMIPARISTFPQGLSPDSYGILTPIQIIPTNPKALDLVLVPGLVFDRQGFRIGYGGGYYDRFLPQLNPQCKTVGLIHSDFLVPTLPTESHDIPISHLVTEEKVIRI